jgi:hypothetical protein
MSDIILRCQIRAGASPATDPAGLMIARLTCAAQAAQDLDAVDPRWSCLTPWRWTGLGWYAAKDDHTFENLQAPTSEAIAPLTAPAAAELQRRLGLVLPDGGQPGTLAPGSPAAANAARVEVGAAAPHPIAIGPLAFHSGRTWMNTLEGLGTGPGALGRKLSLTALLRPPLATLPECLNGRHGFAPGFTANGVTYTPTAWTKVQLPEGELDDTNREALLVTYAASAAGVVVRALVLPSLKHDAAAPKSYVDAGTLEVALGAAAGGQASRFDRNWPATYVRKVAEAFDLTARMTEPAITGDVYHPVPPTDADEADWLKFLDGVFVAVARDASGVGVMATPERIVPAARLLHELSQRSGADDAVMADEVRDTVLTALATYETKRSAADWLETYKAFVAAEAAGGRKGAGVAAELAARTSLLSRQDITAALMLRQLSQALEGPDGQGYGLTNNQRVPLAQAYVSPALPGQPSGWVSLVRPDDGGDQTFLVDLYLKPATATNGDLATILLTADPTGAAAGGDAELKARVTAAGVRLKLDSVDFGGTIEKDDDGGYRIRVELLIPAGHEPIGLRARPLEPVGGQPAVPVPALGSRPPMLELVALRSLNLKFGDRRWPGLLGRPSQAGVDEDSFIFQSPFRERLAKLDPQGWMLQAPMTLVGSAISGLGTAAADPNAPLRDRILQIAADAFGKYVDARLQAGVAAPLLPPPTPAANDAARLTHLKAILKRRFKDTFGDPGARESTALVPLESGDAGDLPIPDAHPIVAPYDLGDAVEFNDLLGETTGVAVLVQADGRAFDPVGGQPQFADVFTLNAAAVQFGWGGAAEELAFGDRPTPKGGVDIRTFEFNARPLVAPLRSETVAEDDANTYLYRVRPFDAVDAAEEWGETIPQMRFGWKYRFRAFFVAQGGALPPDLWRGANPTKLRRPAVDENGFGPAYHYLCRTAIGTPRWDARKGGVTPPRVPDGGRPLAGELPDLPAAVDVPQGGFATFYVSEQDGSGLVPHDTGATLDLRLYGLQLRPGGEAVLSLRKGRLNSGGPDAVKVRLRGGAAPNLQLAGGEVIVTLPEGLRDKLDAGDIGEWHVQLSIGFTPQGITLSAALLLEAGDAGAAVAALEPDHLHLALSLGRQQTIVPAVGEGEAFIRIEAVGASLRVTPPRVYAGPYRVVCPETAGQQPETVAIDTSNTDVRIAVRPPTAPFNTWVRHLLSDTALLATDLDARIDHAHSAGQSRGSGSAGADATLDHPRVTRLFLEVVPLFPRTRTAGSELHEFHLVADAQSDPYGDRKQGITLVLRRGAQEAFDPDHPKATVQVAAQVATITVARGHIAEVRIYGAAHISDFEGPKARFTASFASGRRRQGDFVLGAPLRLRVEAAADAAFVDAIVKDLGGKRATFWRERFTASRMDNFEAWADPVVDGAGQLTGVRALPRLAPPGSRKVARLLRYFGGVTVAAQAWSWRGRPGADQAPDDEASFAQWSTRLFFGRSDTDAEFQGPIALTPQHIRGGRNALRQEALDRPPATPLLQRDMSYRGTPTLWRFAIELHGRYPSEPGFNRRTLTNQAQDKEADRHARWAHLLARGALSLDSGVSFAPPEIRRPPLEVWLPLAEQMREASAAAPVMLMFAEPWHARGDLSDRLEVVSLLARHPYPKAYVATPIDERPWTPATLVALFGHNDFLTAAQFPKFRQSWGPDPTLTGEAAPFSAVSLATRGPLGWSQSEGARSDFRRASFVVEPFAQAEDAARLLAYRPMFQLAYRRVADPDLMDLPRDLPQRQALWALATEHHVDTKPWRRLGWDMFPPTATVLPGETLIKQPAGYQGVRLDWTPSQALVPGTPLVMIIQDALPTVQASRRFVISAEREGENVRVRCAISEPLMAQDPPDWRVNHLPPLDIEVGATGKIELRVEVSPTAPTTPPDPGVAPTAPDTFDIVVWARGAMTPDQPAAEWQGGCLARFKAPQGSGALQFDLPGTARTLGQEAGLRPFVASGFSTGVWCQFSPDSSRFRWAFENTTEEEVHAVEDLRVVVPNPTEQRAYFQSVVQTNDRVLKNVLPRIPDGLDAAGGPTANHRLVAVVTKWITDATGRRSEMPVFASPVTPVENPRGYIAFPTGQWPEAGRLRLLTILVTKEAEAFGPTHAPTPTAPFKIMDTILSYSAASDVSPFDLSSIDSEMSDATMMIVGVSRPSEIGEGG